MALLESYESSIDKEIEIQENLNIFFTSEKNKNLLRRNYELSKEKLMISSKQIIFFKKLADDTIHKRANTELLEQVNIGNALENSTMSYADSLKSTRIFIHKNEKNQGEIHLLIPVVDTKLDILPEAADKAESHQAQDDPSLTVLPWAAAHRV